MERWKKEKERKEGEGNQEGGMNEGDSTSTAPVNGMR